MVLSRHVHAFRNPHLLNPEKPQGAELPGKIVKELVEENPISNAPIMAFFSPSRAAV